MSLQGKTVLVTRAVHQAAALIALIKAQGGRALCFPCLEIAPLSPPANREILQESFNYVIFISRNAVEYGLPWLRPFLHAADLKTLAVGKSTAAALSAQGYPPAWHPQTPYNSETLLAHPRLQQLAGYRILIVRGEGGRELLAQTLSARGARVEYLEVYRRLQPQSPDHALHDALQTRQPSIVTVSSQTALENLLAIIVDAEARRALLQTPLLVINPEMREWALQHGFAGGIVLAQDATDQSIIAALCDYFAVMR